jgi:hypothetical protein
MRLIEPNDAILYNHIAKNALPGFGGIPVTRNSGLFQEPHGQLLAPQERQGSTCHGQHPAEHEDKSSFT